ncbi:MAG: UDP-glucose:(heptosyl)LPS alpha-1,3-glucosyltransferase [Candidatus Kentron sp. G]|nr:MAG: UDP-glucose:(heptosyl)LPS alpha-1,3-glucosyltransferase [Candidatus Kentron sp. G]VFN03537.1 MAG: UDP-glucose:(heptosyl)LPS alpha-1,3-glucosyltransferase [Candidatus Kentron sp. G]VFN05209.1 MAG: UDP-glucose:(heptosyl)LPS alpha-1,3-glucosyltransferase [Candidatus Kentron sp. G]
MSNQSSLAFALYKYFPFGGLQRDFLRIAETCHAKGCRIRVYTFDWQGERPSWIELCPVPKKGLTSQFRNRKFTQWVMQHRQRYPVDALIGFNKMPGLDLYYAADGCYMARAYDLYGRFYRLGWRYRHFSHYERAVFGAGNKTGILMISERQRPIFESYYGTEPERFHMLPPGVTRDRIMPADSDGIRRAFRDEFGIAEGDRLLLMVGSGFKTKGVDRAIEALADLPRALAEKSRLFVIGQDNPSTIIKQARKFGVRDRLRVFSGRDDIVRFMLGADILVHPARHENTGTVLLEAIVAGLPVLASAVCGYAHYVTEAGMGVVLEEPFEQGRLNRALGEVLGADGERRRHWRENGKRFSREADIYSMPEMASRIIVSIAGRLRDENLPA